VTTLIRSLHNVGPEHRGGVITIGNFDGVHLGHQQLIAMVKEKAAQSGVPSIVITFEPHPFEFFGRAHATIPRITRLREKFHFLGQCGVDYVLILPFNQKLASLSASDFVDHLQAALAPRHVIIGDDFHFGYKRQGDFHLLETMGKQLGFTVEAMETLLIDGERVSSTRVRDALAKDDQALVTRLLGHPYSMIGKIRKGEQLGRKLGFPTANIHLHRKLTTVRGIYTVYLYGLADHPLPGVANIGIRPTLDSTRTLLEVHLLDFDQDIYGHQVRIEFCKKLRNEERYPNLELLKEQIAKDVLAAREYFKTLS